MLQIYIYIVGGELLKNLITIYLIVIFLFLFTFPIYATSFLEKHLNYAGEIKMTYDGENDVDRPIPDYRLYLQGSPIQGFNLITHLKKGGDIVDNILVTYEKNGYKLKAGDFSFVSVSDNLNINQRHRGGLVVCPLFAGVINIKTGAGKVRSIKTSDEFKGNGAVGPFYLSGSIIPESETVYIDGVQLNNEQYKIDYTRGTITLDKILLKKETLKVVYYYQPGGDYYNRSLKKTSLEFDTKTINGGVSYYEIKDSPLLDNLIIPLQPKILQLKNIRGEFQPYELLNIKGEVISSQYKGRIEKEDILKDSSISVGNELNYLKYNYFNRGPDYYSSLDQEGVDPLEEYSLTARTSLTPHKYLYLNYIHSNDNPTDNKELITTYENKLNIKGYWQLNNDDYIQLIYFKTETGDDLLYLPQGKIGQSLALNYDHKGNPLSFNIQGTRGEWIWKTPSGIGPNMDHKYFELNTELDWSKKKFDASFSSELEYIWFDTNQKSRFDYFWEGEIDYDLFRGSISLGYEKEKDEDYIYDLSQIKYKKRLFSHLQGQISLKKEREEYSYKKNMRDSLGIRLYYVGSFKAICSGNIDEKGFSLNSTVAKDKWKLNGTYIKKENQKKIEGKIIYECEKLNFTTKLTAKQPPTEPEFIYNLNLKIGYKLTKNLELQISSNFPQIKNVREQRTKAQLIYSF